MVKNKKVRLEYGKSMYGGWYAQNVYHGVVFRCDKLKDIKEKIKTTFSWCELGSRVDNI